MNRAHSLWTLFLVLWSLTQLVFGAVTPWLVAVTALALLALNVAAHLLCPEELRLGKATLLYLGIALGIFALQIIPLEFLFPATRTLRSSHGVKGLWPGTADLFLTVRCLVQFLVYVLTALLVLKLRAQGVSASRMMKGVCLVLALQAAYAVIQALGGLPEIPFYGPRESLDSASGTFVNRNTLGGILAMGLVASAALAYSGLVGGRSVEAGIGWALVTALFALGIVLSKSRGGAIGASVGLLLLPLLHRGGPSLAAAGVVVLVGGVGVLLADPSVLLERFGELEAQGWRENSRFKIWSASAAAALDQPLLGFGMGTYPSAFHPYQPASMAGEVHHAHDEYVNFLFEGGLSWLVVQLGGLAVWTARSWKGARALAGPDRILPAAAIAAVGAEAVHSLVDFDLRVTSAGMLLGVLLGLGAAVQGGAPARPQPKLAGALLVLSLVASLALMVLPLDSEGFVREAAESEKPQAQRLCLRALGLSPYNFRAAWVLARASEEDPDRALGGRRYSRAADLYPAHPGLQRDVGLWFFIRHVESGEGKDLEEAARAYRRLFLQRPDLVEENLRVIWQKSRSLGDYEALLPGTPEAAGEMAGFLVGKGKWREAMDLFRRACPESPQNAPVFDRFAARLEKEGQWGLEAFVRDRRLKQKSDPPTHAQEARAWGRLEAYDRALPEAAVARRMDPGNPEWAALAGDLEREAGHLDAALQAYMEAIRLAPLRVDLRVKRASLYEAIKLYSAAAEDYQVALRSRPGDGELVLGLARSQAAAGDRAKARETLLDYLRGHPADAPARQLLGDLSR
jgi:tetratricopeptide (TPR) repeat protein/O-antigen ligase